MLQKSGDPVLSKRASSLWNNYFITCAICNNISGKNARDCFYCNECKCMVCTNCSCEKFHLSYQLSQWDEMYAEEAAEKSSKAKAKKKKRKKRNNVKRRRKKLRPLRVLTIGEVTSMVVIIKIKITIILERQQ